MQTLNEMLAESKIFAKREILSPHYIPKKLIGRTKEINSIEKALAPSLKGDREKPVHIRKDRHGKDVVHQIRA